MKVLRENKESLMAVLEAFVHDPLIGWRLLGPNEGKNNPSKDISIEEEDEAFSSSALVKDKVGKSLPDDVDVEAPEALNEKAIAITTRIQNKLTGKDFSQKETLDVKQQVQRLIKQATDLEILCQSYLGW